MLLLLACALAETPAPPPSPAPSPAKPAPSMPAPEPTLRFTCETAAADLGQPDATVRLCREEQVLRGLYTVVLAGPRGQVVRAVAVEDGAIVPERGGAALARFLRRSTLWRQERIAAQELQTALRAFVAWPPGFTEESGPRTVGADGKPVFLPLPDLVVTVETTRAAWEKHRRSATGAADATPGVSKPAALVRATLRGGPSQPLAWTVEEQRGDAWVPVETLALEP